MNTNLRFFVLLSLALAIFYPKASFGAWTAKPVTPYSVYEAGGGQRYGYGQVELKNETTGARKYVTASTAISTTSAGAMVRGVLARPMPSTLLTAAGIYAAGWIYDELTDEVQVPGETFYEADYQNITSSCSVFGQTGCALYGSVWKCGTTMLARNDAAVEPCSYPVLTGQILNNCTSYANCGGKYPHKKLVPGTSYGSTKPTQFDTEGQGVSDADVGENAFNDNGNMTDVVNDNLTSGDWQNNWAEMEATLEALRQAFENNDTTVTNNATETSTSVTNHASSTGTASQSTTSPTALEFPVFCEWAGVVCTFLDWMQAPATELAHPEIPTEEVSLEQDWDSGLGEGSCPAAYSVSYGGETAALSYENACWAAESVFKPVLLALCLISAGFIIAGARP